MACDEQFRKLPVRFLGYGSAIGQAASYVFPPAEILCSIATSVFSLLHVVCTAWKTKKIYPTFKVLIWEIVSELLPVVVVYFGCQATVWLMGQVGASNAIATTVVPCAVGLGLCVGCQQPLDQFSDDIAGMFD